MQIQKKENSWMMLSERLRAKFARRPQTQILVYLATMTPSRLQYKECWPCVAEFPHPVPVPWTFHSLNAFTFLFFPFLLVLEHLSLRKTSNAHSHSLSHPS